MLMRTIGNLMGVQQQRDNNYMKDGELPHGIIGTISAGQGCLYCILEYVGSKYGLSYSANDYSNDYVYGTLSDNDGWSGSLDEYEENGPRTFLPDPDDPQGAIFNPSIMEYFQSKFTMGSDTWTRGSTDIHDMYFTASGSRNSSGELFAVIHPGSGSNTHAVILESYSNGAYSYYDAQNNCHSSIPANRIIVAGEITGSRK